MTVLALQVHENRINSTRVCYGRPACVDDLSQHGALEMTVA